MFHRSSTFPLVNQSVILRYVVPFFARRYPGKSVAEETFMGPEDNGFHHFRGPIISETAHLSWIIFLNHVQPVQCDPSECKGSMTMELSTTLICKYSLQHIDLISLFGNIEEMTINAATTLLFTTTLSRFYDFYTNRRAYYNVIFEADVNLRRAMKNDWKMERPIIQEQIVYINKLTVFFWVCALITANSMNLQAIIEYLVGRNDADEEVKVHWVHLSSILFKIPPLSSPN